MEDVGGFDERFGIEYSDVDLCLRLRLLGYKILYTPFATLLHDTKSRRENDAPDGKSVALFLRRWRDYLRDDPFSNPGIDKYKIDIAPILHGENWYNRSFS